jgi:uncharacterized membrane protein HdeD (DUF308 family)
MAHTLSYNWWAVALRGLAALIFGLLAFMMPGITLTVLIYWFGAYALWDGIFAIISSIRQREGKKRWWALFLEGLVGVGAGITTFLWPGVTAFVLVYIIAFWALVTGMFEVIAAIHLRKEIEGELFLALSGVLSVIFAIALVFWPGLGAFAILWMIASYSIAFGVLLIFLAVRLRTTVDIDIPHAKIRSAA